MPLAPGLTGTASLEVTDDHLAVAVGSGDVPVLATPAVVALCEKATVGAVAGSLEPGTTTVGTRVDIEHLAPSVVGAVVVASGRLTGVDGRRLTFAVEAHDGDVLVARGSVWRAVVDRERFVGRLG